MRVVIQRALNASCVVDDKTTGAIKKGLLLLVGFTKNDSLEDIDYLVRKVSNIRIFEDDKGLMNKSLEDINGSILSISQFTLYGDTKKGNRPSFTEALEPIKAKEYYQLFNKKLRENGLNVEEGIFQADMKITFTNDGPVTIIVDSKNR